MKALLGFALLAATVLSFAQDIAPKAELKLDKTTAVAGSTVKGKIILTFADGLHGYQNPPSDDYQIPTKIEAAKGTTLLKTIYPKGEPFLMSGEEKPAMVYQGRVEIPVEIKVPAKAGKQTIKLAVNYQQCNDNSCFPPGKIELSSKLTVTAAPKKK
ncbi:MAG: protein-disulfide reductase DsbD domain-containing protein [Fimbriimonas sp.]